MILHFVLIEAHSMLLSIHGHRTRCTVKSCQVIIRAILSDAYTKRGSAWCDTGICVQIGTIASRLGRSSEVGL